LTSPKKMRFPYARIPIFHGRGICFLADPALKALFAFGRGMRNVA